MKDAQGRDEDPASIAQDLMMAAYLLRWDHLVDLGNQFFVWTSLLLWTAFLLMLLWLAAREAGRMPRESAQGRGNTKNKKLNRSSRQKRKWGFS